LRRQFARLRCLLEPGGDVDGVAGGEPLLGAGDDLAGVHTDAELEREAVVLAELIIQIVERVGELAGCTQRT
jgi:hypothetical protein